jgi:hypothetical protein
MNAVSINASNPMMMSVTAGDKRLSVEEVEGGSN